MRHLIAKRLSAARSAIAPVMLLEEMLVAGRSRHEGRFAAADAQPLLASGPGQAIFHRSPLIVFLTMACQRRDAIRFIVDRSHNPGDEALGDDLAHEYHAAVAAVPHIETQIQLGEISIARPRHSEDARIEE